MPRSVLSARIDNELSDRLKAFYNKWGELSKAKKGQLSKDDITALKEEYNGIVQDGLKIRDEVAAVTGYKESYQQSVSSGAFEGMSQETGDEMNGRLTGIQIATEGTYQVIQSIDSKLGAIIGFSDYKEDASTVPEMPIISHPINNSDSILNANFAAMANSTSQMFLAYDEGRTILAQSLMYLQSIDERQEKWHKPMLQAFNRIGRIADKVERL